MLYIIVMLILGGVGLYYGSDFLIKGVSSFSLRAGLPAFIVGMVVVGFGTSTPELFVSIIAALQGKGDITLGNVVGSNIANIGLVLGICSLYKPFPIPWKAVRFDAVIMIILSIIFSVFLYYSVFNRVVGLLFLLGLISYMTWLIVHGRAQMQAMHHEPEEDSPDLNPSLTTDILQMSGGLLVLLLGARLFYTGAIELTIMFGISDAIVGLTIVALGTSLPELAASIMAVKKKKGDIALGNIVGSCIYNILGIVGFTALIHPYKTIDITPWDYIVMTFLAVIVVVMMRTGKKIYRLEGAVLLTTYIIYMYTLATCLREGGKMIC